MKKLYVKELDTELGKLRLICDDSFIIRLLFENDNLVKVRESLAKTFGEIVYFGENVIAARCAGELCSYLDGKLQSFTVEPAFYGTAFEQKVWQGLRHIRYGTTVTYTELGKQCGLKGARAVGSAVGRNPVPLIVPCHRVIRADGGLGGFRGGLANKRILLAVEGIRLQA